MPMEQRLKSPDLKKVQAFINVCRDACEKIQELTGEDAENEAACFYGEDILELQEQLEWILTKLSNQKDYHKQRQFQQAAEKRLLEEALRAKGYDLDAIKKRARNLAADELVDASTEEPVKPRGER